MSRSLLGVTMLLLMAFTSVQSVMASGTEFSLSGSDLLVNVNTKWVGCREGGYFPIRTMIRNNGKARTITLEISPNNSSQKCPTVSRTFSLEQNATINASLLIPMVSRGSYADFRVLEKGREIKKLSKSLSLPEVSGSSDVGPSMLVVARKVEEFEFYNKAINHLLKRSSSAAYGVDVYAQHVRPNELPVNWLGYTGIDLLAIPLETFAQDVSVETRNSILQWVSSGGNLLIYDVGEKIVKSASLEETINWKNRAFIDKKWSGLDIGKMSKLEVVSVTAPTVASTEDFSGLSPWKMTQGNFAIRSLGLGKVIAMTDSPFPGTISHWNWLLGHYSNDRLLWHNRNGMVPRSGSNSFFQFLIPNVGRVPVFSLLVLITIFTILIGPVNYIYYLRKRQLAMLLITVPIIAFGSSLTLLAYSTITHGFSVKSRVRSITYLDQKQNHAMSVSRVAYFAGMAPSEGLSFEPTTAVYPIWPVNESFVSGRINWSESQHFQNGWLRSRTRTQFLTVSQQDQRGRLILKNENAATPKVSNGLKWDIESLILVDEAGKAWFAKNLVAGKDIELKPVTEEDREDLRKYLNEHDLILPNGVSSSTIAQDFSPPNAYAHYGRYQLPTNYKNNLSEKNLSSFSLPTNKRKHELKPGSYFAILKQEPDLDLGLKKSKKNISVHLLFGYF